MSSKGELLKVVGHQESHPQDSAGRWIFALTALTVIAWSVWEGMRRVDAPRQANLEGLEEEGLAESFTRLSRMPQFRALRWIFLRRLAKYRPFGLVVDVGCGPGLLVEAIALRYPALRLVGVDIAAPMVARACESAAASGLARQVSFRVGDAQSLPFSDASVDFLVSTLSLHHWPDPVAALAEARRVLRPGGQFLFFDLRRDAPRFVYRLACLVTRFVVPPAIRHIGEPLGSFRAAYTAREGEQLLAGSLFTDWSVDFGPAWLFLWGRR
ncbi:MAG: class I SAM-dependent methyltransferase [Coprothermobacterota bacterium]|nr:class I SAM-dependent methyltransferase [Coprothermobacterota bacterium]